MDRQSKGSGRDAPRLVHPAAGEHPGTAVTTALLVLVMGLSLAFVPVVLFPVLRRVDGVLAIGYLVVRGFRPAEHGAQVRGSVVVA